MDFCIFRCFIWCGDTSEVWNHAGASFLVEPFWITLLCDLDRDIDVDLDEGNFWVGATLWLLCM